MTFGNVAGRQKQIMYSFLLLCLGEVLCRSAIPGLVTVPLWFVRQDEGIGALSVGVFDYQPKKDISGHYAPIFFFCITNEKVIMKDRMQGCDYNSEPVYQQLQHQLQDHPMYHRHGDISHYQMQNLVL